MEEVIYNKVCKYCGKEYTSSSRNQRYCSDECSKKAQKKNRAKGKRAIKRRDAYDLDKELNRLIARAYSLTASVADQLIPCECCMKGVPGHECSGPLEVYHLDSNPLNISPDNLVRLCRAGHEEFQKELPEVSLVSILREAKHQEKPGAVFKEYFEEGRKIGGEAYAKLFE